MIDPHDPCPPAHLPPERLAVLGLLTPLFCGILAVIFAFPSPPACSVAFLLLVGVLALITAYTDGAKEVRIRFVVVEAGTGRPIQGAKVVLLIPNDSEPSRETSTGPAGMASIVAGCQVVRRRALCWEATAVYFTGRWFHVTAEGCEGTGREYLAWHTGRVRDIGHADPPPIRVELKRLPAAGKG
jgi:hypothetical protein